MSPDHAEAGNRSSIPVDFFLLPSRPDTSLTGPFLGLSEPHIGAADQGPQEHGGG